MDERTLTQIDYFRIRNQVADYCVSVEGRDALLQRMPSVNSGEIIRLKNLSREWILCHASAKNPALRGWEAVGPLIPIIKTDGASLSLEQVRALGQFVLSVRGVKKYICARPDDLALPAIFEEVSRISDHADAESRIFRVIDEDGELRDLPEITAIRKQIADLRGKIKSVMQSYISDQKYASVLESSVPVLRGDRQVLAVKASFRKRIPGIVYEVSQSGRTVYVEPEDAVLCSNELVQKEYELQAVIKRILADLTAALQPCAVFFADALPVMLLLDTTLAAAKWGIEHNCVFAADIEADKEPPILVQARHPLLGSSAVPIDIRFMEGKRVLIITGPNTGGKTVSLKTFALLSMLNQSGFPVPAGEGTRLPVFGSVFADIGDDQSLDQSLSTFSGHMRNIARAVSNAAPDSLVLLDELGSGTDPQEGTAIAMAVLDSLIKKRSFVLVTTHQGILKNYGYTNPSCINASVEFNQDSLAPSYHLVMGVPGESHALEIAERSGLPAQICMAARNYIATEQADVSALIRGLNRKHQELSRLQKDALRREREYAEKSERLKSRELDLRRRENELKKGKSQEMNDFLVHSRRQLENLMRTLREGELTREKTVGVNKFIGDLTSGVRQLEAKIEREDERISDAFARAENKSHGKNAAAASFAPGMVVKSGSMGTEGVLLEQIRKGVWQVQFGSIKMSVKEKELAPAKKQSAPQAHSGGHSGTAYSSYMSGDGAERPAFELRLLGMRCEEAQRALERQIDLCILNNFLHFSVIHGKGDGILMQMVRDYLSHCPSVADFEPAPAEDGGAGKTYVTLRG